MSKYTQSQVNRMEEKEVRKLFNTGKIEDDMVQRWYDNKEDEDYLFADALEEFGWL